MPLSADQLAVIAAAINGGAKQSEIARALKISRSTLIRNTPKDILIRIRTKTVPEQEQKTENNQTLSGNNNTGDNQDNITNKDDIKSQIVAREQKKVRELLRLHGRLVSGVRNSLEDSDNADKMAKESETKGEQTSARKLAIAARRQAAQQMTAAAKVLETLIQLERQVYELDGPAITDDLARAGVVLGVAKASGEAFAGLLDRYQAGHLVAVDHEPPAGTPVARALPVTHPHTAAAQDRNQDR